MYLEGPTIEQQGKGPKKKKKGKYNTSECSTLTGESTISFSQSDIN